MRVCLRACLKPVISPPESSACRAVSQIGKTCRIIGPLGWHWPAIELTDRQLGKLDQAFDLMAWMAQRTYCIFIRSSVFHLQKSLLFSILSCLLGLTFPTVDWIILSDWKAVFVWPSPCGSWFWAHEGVEGFCFFSILTEHSGLISPLWGKSQELLCRHAREVKKKKKKLQPKPNGEPNPWSQHPGTSEREQRLLGRCHHKVWRGREGMKADSRAEQIQLRWFIDHRELVGDEFRCVSNHSGSLIIMLLGCLVPGLLGNLSPWGLIFSKICSVPALLPSAVYSIVVLFFHLLHCCLIWWPTTFPIPKAKSGTMVLTSVHTSVLSWAQLTVSTIHRLYVFK